eukprot:4036865-Pleurochrysis_carterae.AAC.1
MNAQLSADARALVLTRLYDNAESHWRAFLFAHTYICAFCKLSVLMHAHPNINLQNRLRLQHAPSFRFKPCGWYEFLKGKGVAADPSEAVILYTLKRIYR